MTKLSAVNEMLEAIGLPAVDALDTGGTSEEAEAETLLDRWNRRVQAGGWACNEEQGITLEIATDSIQVSGGAGTFTVRETVTESVSGATGEFVYIDTSVSPNLMYLTNLTGTFTGAQTLTGGTSAATRTGATRAAVTSSKISVDTDAWLKIQPHRVLMPRPFHGQSYASEIINFVVRGGFLYDADQNTYTFEQDVVVDRVLLLAFTNLPETLATYVLRSATVAFQRFKKRGQVDDALAQQQLAEARVRANQEDSDLRRVNVLQTHEAMRVKGNRNDAVFRQSGVSQ
jgi:hypothetical protein